MAYQIRAMSFAELLDTAFRLVRDHFLLLIGIASAVYIPLAVVNEGVQPAPGQIVWGRLAAAVALSLVAVPIVFTALTHAVGEIYLGRQTSIGKSFGVALGLIVPMTGTMLLVYLGILGGIILLVIPGLVLSMAWILTSPVVVFEGRYGPAALRRSRELMRGHKWRAAGVLLVGWIIVAVLGAVLGGSFHLVPLLGPIGQGIAQSIGVSYSTVVLVLLYFDIRCRKESFDLEHLARLVEGGATQAA
jgi:hypothetical protein